MSSKAAGAGPAGELRTSRLRLRPFTSADRCPLGAIHRDPEVTRFLNRVVDPARVDDVFWGLRDHWRRHGFGAFAMEPLEALEPGGDRAILGFVGVAYPTFIPALAHRPELGWRLARAAWGRGLAFEGAVAAREHAERVLGLRLISIIHPDNVRSQRLAARLGMSVERRVVNPVLQREVDVWSVAPA